MLVNVVDNNGDYALRILKKKMQRDGIYRDIKIHKRHEKRSVKLARKRAEAARRYRKAQRKLEIG